MHYISTNHNSPPVGFLEAVERGLAPDGGLYVPQSYPNFADQFIEELPFLTMTDICLEVLKSFVGDDLSGSELLALVKDSISFDAPLVKLKEGLYVLELFHGPTLAFKDFGVRFMARLMSHTNKYERTVLTATSGDTGAAVASAFYGLPGMKAVILYPNGKISDFQERQISGMGANVKALAVDGTFDDCQRLVKQAFKDQKLRSCVNLVSANSINLARLLPQIAYFLRAYGQLKEILGDLTVSVPSGNFGDICAGLMAKRMGLAVQRFVAATNANDVIPRFLESGVYAPGAVVETISNAMDISDPSNFSRILSLYGNDLAELRKDMSAYSYSDEATRNGMREVYETYGYVCDPHAALAYIALKKVLLRHKGVGIFLETAHPLKFVSIVEAALGVQYEVGAEYHAVMEREKKALAIDNSYDALRDLLI